jgi:prepilin-type N-terminal cleavage/methylation domain-containing protein
LKARLKYSGVKARAAVAAHGGCPGFTLIELSIVLVIVGLIVGGVLVGRDLINAAEIRAQISQIEKYNTAVQTFRIKYNALPGDMVAAAAARFGMQARSGAAAHGDGDGLLDSCITNWTTIAAGCETVLFWRDLSYASLIDGSFTTATDIPAVVPAAQMPLYFPVAKLGNGNYISVWYQGGVNRFAVGKFITGVAGQYTIDNGMTPAQAKAIDAKLDDGEPFGGNLSGRVYPFSAGNAFTIISVAAGGCLNTPPLRYNVDPAFADALLCDMSFKFN